MSVDTPYSTEYPTIVKFRDCRRCFHFRAIFHIAIVMPPADRCSISRLAVQFWWFWRPSPVEIGDPAQLKIRSRRLLPN